MHEICNIFEGRILGVIPTHQALEPLYEWVTLIHDTKQLGDKNNIGCVFLPFRTISIHRESIKTEFYLSIER